MEIIMVNYSPHRHLYGVDLGSVLMSLNVLLVQIALWHAVAFISMEHWWYLATRNQNASFQWLPLPSLRPLHFHWPPWTSLTLTRIHSQIRINHAAIYEGPSGHAPLYYPWTLCQNMYEDFPGCFQSPPGCVLSSPMSSLYFYSSISSEGLTLRSEEGIACYLKARLFFYLSFLLIYSRKRRNRFVLNPSYLFSWQNMTWWFPWGLYGCAQYVFKHRYWSRIKNSRWDLWYAFLCLGFL